MKWIPLINVSQLEQIAERSKSVSCLIFKHSTRCNISAIAKFRLEDDWRFTEEQVEAYFLDLLQHRDISAAVAERFNVYHESPQILLIENGECDFDASHLDITVDEIAEQLSVK